MPGLKIAKKVLLENLNLQSDESLLILTDKKMHQIAMFFLDAALEISDQVSLLLIPMTEKSGQEPGLIAAHAMKNVDAVICITTHSITHTKARKEACLHGTRVATMPGLTMSMLEKGALYADNSKLVQKVNEFVDKLNKTSEVMIAKDEHQLTFSIKNRKGIPSTGLIRNKAEYGNIPSGEAYIAPIESSANGTILIDGSIANIGLLSQPLLLVIKEGILTEAIGPDGKKLMELLGDEKGRTIAEFGIGANDGAILCGNILEDEKALGTIHIAFGSNHTFGGTNNTSVHIDCIVKNPLVYFDGDFVPLI